MRPIPASVFGPVRRSRSNKRPHHPHPAVCRRPHHPLRNMIKLVQYFVRAGLFFWLIACGLGTTQAAVPQRLNHQGRVAVNGVNFDGNGQFKFALVNAGGTVSYWSNDGTGTAGSPPTAAVSLAVTFQSLAALTMLSFR